eukprot:scaffold2858_cov659-Pavlova_lutheri.AAC.220
MGRGETPKEKELGGGMAQHDGTSRRALHTRVIVKNLPKYLDEKRMREHFGAMGEVTDVKIVRLKDDTGGTKSRQFGFVGYRTDEEAAKAVKYFHRTFIDTSRINVDLARRAGDAEIPRPWSKHSVGSSAFEKRNPTQREERSGVEPVGQEGDQRGQKKHNVIDPKLEQDPDFQEFMQVMQPRTTSKLWANDDTAPGRENAGKRMPRPKKGESKNNREVQLVESRAPGGAGMYLKRMHERFVDDEDENSVDSSDGEYQDMDENGTDSEGDADEIQETDHAVVDEGVTDLDYLRSRMKKAIGEDEQLHEDPEAIVEEELPAESGHDTRSSSSEETSHGNSVENEEGDVEGDTQATGGGASESPDNEIEPERLFIKNIPYTTTEAELAEVFSEFGELETVHIVQDKMARRSKGIAYVSYAVPEDSRSAKEEMNGNIFQGRIIHVQFALAPPSAKASAEGKNDRSTSYKSEKEAEKKAKAGTDFVAWNSLFIRQDTAASVAAAQQGISKSELLDPSAGDLPVRQALAETAVIADTKRHLGLAGVNVPSLENFAAAAGAGGGKRAGRSTTALLLKNLPFSAGEEDILPILNKFGGVARVVIPPTNALAIVEYLEPSEARAAFKGLAYKRFKDAPLYVEWAPEDVFSTPAPTQQQLPETAVQTPGGAAVAAAAARRAAEVAGLDDETSTTVFVKNLMFGTGDEKLKEHFATGKVGTSLRAARVARRQGKNGKMLSQGYGFLEYATQEDAARAIKEMQGTVLDGHKLELHFSAKGREEGMSGNRSKVSLNSPKIIIRNLAFEANKKELYQLLTPFSQVKSIRLPKKFDGGHRGFAFVEFSTKQEASTAMEALGRSHFYGRHLVIERAKEDDTLEEIRKRTAKQFEAGAGMVQSKKLKFLQEL